MQQRTTSPAQNCHVKDEGAATPQGVSQLFNKIAKYPHPASDDQEACDDNGHDELCATCAWVAEIRQQQASND